MKIHSFVADLVFFLLILLLLIEPVIVSLILPVQGFTKWSFPFAQLVNAFFALFIFLYYKDKSDNEKSNATIILLKKVFPGTIALCLLFCSALLFKGVTFFVKNEFWVGNQEVILPDSFYSYLNCILSFIFAAFYEEVIYRFYFPEILRNFIFKKFNTKLAHIFSEIIALAFFASGHIYLGGFAFINSIIGHGILRMCLVKSKSIWPGFIAHFIYNLLVLFLL